MSRNRQRLADSLTHIREVIECIYLYTRRG